MIVRDERVLQLPQTVTVILEPKEKAIMNILIVVPWWFPAQGGVVTAVDNLSKNLKRKGHRVTLLLPDYSEKIEVTRTQDGIELHRIYLRDPVDKKKPIKGMIAFLMFFPATAINLWRLVRQNKIDVINLHYLTGNNVYFPLLKRLLRKKLILSIWGADISVNPYRSRLSFMVLNWIIKKSDFVVACSKQFLREATQTFPIIGKKAGVIYPGVDLKEFDNKKSFTVLNRPTSQRYILSVANLEKWKGLDVLIRAFKAVAEEVSGVILLIAGDGPERNNLVDLAAKLGMSSRIVFAGSVGHDEIVPLFQNCEFFVLPSRVEPFGIVFLEAFACRKAVIGTNVGGIPEFVKHYYNGLLIDCDNVDGLRDGMKLLLKDQALREKLASNGYTTVTHGFSWDISSQEYLAVMSGLADRERKTRTRARKMTKGLLG